MNLGRDTQIFNLQQTYNSNCYLEADNIVLKVRSQPIFLDNLTARVLSCEKVESQAILGGRTQIYYLIFQNDKD